MRSAVFAAFVVALAGAVASEPALAHGGSRVSVGVGFGFGYPYWGAPWGPWYYPPPPIYYPVVVPARPVTYIEQRSAAAPAPAPVRDAWWYYCEGSKGYYPYVRECPAGWERVPPTPVK
jgi:hypothetical protein